MSRDWNPMRAAYEPRVWPAVIGLCAVNFVACGLASYLIGYTLGPVAQWIALIPLFVLAAWSGNALVHRIWRKWREKHPERPYTEWQWQAPR